MEVAHARVTQLIQGRKPSISQSGSEISNSQVRPLWAPLSQRGEQRVIRHAGRGAVSRNTANPISPYSGGHALYHCVKACTRHFLTPRPVHRPGPLHAPEARSQQRLHLLYLVRLPCRDVRKVLPRWDPKGAHHRPPTRRSEPEFPDEEIQVHLLVAATCCARPSCRSTRLRGAALQEHFQGRVVVDPDDDLATETNAPCIAGRFSRTSRSPSYFKASSRAVRAATSSKGVTCAHEKARGSKNRGRWQCLGLPRLQIPPECRGGVRGREPAVLTCLDYPSQFSPARGVGIHEDPVPGLGPHGYDPAHTVLGSQMFCHRGAGPRAPRGDLFQELTPPFEGPSQVLAHPRRPPAQGVGNSGEVVA
jgi:hypothetical protein